MAAIEKMLNTRIQLKYDSYTNWSTNNPTLKPGEVAIAYLASASDTNKPTPDNGTYPVLFKVGPGAFNSLPWTSALAADVHAWAKKSEDEFKAWVKGLIEVTDIDAYSKGEVDGLLAANSQADQKYAKDYADGLAKNYDAAGTAQGLVDGLNVTDTAVTGQYVSAVSEEKGKITVTRADLPTYTLGSGSANGTVAFNGADVAVAGLKSAAYTDAKDYATAAQGAKADSAVQTIATGETNGTIKVDGNEVAVKGLGSAAYTNVNAYATAEQGTKADSAVQKITVLGHELTDGGSVTVEQAKTDLGLGSAAYTEAGAYATAEQGSKADSAVQKITVLDKELTNGGSVSVAEAKTALGLKSAAYEEASAFDAAGSAAAVLGTAADEATANTVYGAKAAAAKAQADIDAFFAAAEKGDAALDTLKEIQDFLNSDSGAVSEIVKDVAEAKEAIEDIVDGTTKVASAANADVAAKASGLDAAGEAAVKAVKVDNAGNADTLGNVAAADYLQKSQAPGYDDILTKTNAATLYQPVGNYATAAQGALADSALQKADITEGTANGTIAVEGTNVAVHGLGSAAYTEAEAYATAAQGAKADTAVQPAALNDYYTKSAADAEFMNSTETDSAIDAKITALNLTTTYEPIGAETRAKAYTDGLAKNYATAAQGALADTALQEIKTTENGGLKVTNKNQIDIDENVVFVFNCGSASTLVD